MDRKRQGAATRQPVGTVPARYVLEVVAEIMAERREESACRLGGFFSRRGRAIPLGFGLCGLCRVVLGERPGGYRDAHCRDRNDRKNASRDAASWPSSHGGRGTHHPCRATRRGARTDEDPPAEGWAQTLSSSPRRRRRYRSRASRMIF